MAQSYVVYGSKLCSLWLKAIKGERQIHQKNKDRIEYVSVKWCDWKVAVKTRKYLLQLGNGILYNV